MSPRAEMFLIIIIIFLEKWYSMYVYFSFFLVVKVCLVIPFCLNHSGTHVRRLFFVIVGHKIFEFFFGHDTF
jgi:hypothetical protein